MYLMYRYGVRRSAYRNSRKKKKRGKRDKGDSIYGYFLVVGTE